MNAFTSMHASLRMASYVPHLFAVNNLCFNYTFSVCKCFRLLFFFLPESNVESLVNVFRSDILLMVMYTGILFHPRQLNVFTF